MVENQKNPHPDRQAHVDEVLHLGWVYIPTNKVVLQRAKQYEAQGIKPFDALHLTSAVEAGVAYFCTTDDRLLRKGKAADTGPVSVVSPLELVVLLN